jgi:hypothetical protein
LFKPIVSGVWCGAIDPSGQYVIVRQTVYVGRNGECYELPNRERSF